ncbi:MAG: secretion protein [Gammaproteobacteria bacterium]|uniref:secretion protein n=1 Tax=Limnobacter sp. TaxID=2003368 RepID=UPI001D32E8FE|nr:secretion protein [Limnobacter sp.]MBU0784219.1 secretion protein [Gammaproteobacteria bacterium]MBU0848376.1 secretion protein [Gammaproteobacteria bacterium]MBU1268221.1 secretion protein [Gammaproteobacteria bacterium]MBU1529253.1 secretion protein [Gammaproteobacteria bacterium]MBU1780415.1 secretion protein [Gammaproteobacteria bacterium]
MSRFIPNARLGKLAAAVTLALCIANPAAAEQNAARSFVDMVKEVPLVPANMRDSEMLAKVTEAVKYIKRLELPQAHFAVNEALQLDPRNSHLHFLNGFVYHLQARQGDTQKGEMAQEGYEQALRIDPSNWIAQEFLGLAHMDLKQFDKAKRAFSEVLLLTPDSAVSAYGLMVASYVTGDAKTACAMADQFRKVSEISSHGFIRSSIAVYASCGNFTQAEYMRDILNSFYQGGPEVQRADRRVAQWKSFYSNQPVSLKQQPEQLAQAFDLPAVPYPKPSKPAPEPDAAVESVPVAQAPAPAVADAASGPRMLLIDVVLLSTQELISTSKGVNLLNALTLQLGNVAGNVAAYSRVNNSTVTNGGAADVSTAITRAVTIPALSYSLNIANANSSLNEVLARPTLAAIEGLPSEFFSGTNLSAGFVSTSVQGGTTVVPLEKRIGIKLAVTPVFLPQGRIQLKVEAQRTNLNATTENPRVAYQIEIGETTANANVVMNLGDTLVLSGLSEKSSASNRDGVPGLQDVPGLQYLFSNKRTNDLQRSVLILVTPRSPVQISNDANRESDSMDNRMKMLRDKFGFSNTMPGNIEAVMTQLDSNDFFREFRQGDVTMERWERMRSTGDRLREALEFLYY